MRKVSLQLLVFSSILFSSFGYTLGDSVHTEIELNKLCCIDAMYCQYVKEIEPVTGSEPGKVVCPDGYGLSSDFFIDGSFRLVCAKTIKIKCVD